MNHSLSSFQQIVQYYNKKYTQPITNNHQYSLSKPLNKYNIRKITQKRKNQIQHSLQHSNMNTNYYKQIAKVLSNHQLFSNLHLQELPQAKQTLYHQYTPKVLKRSGDIKIVGNKMKQINQLQKSISKDQNMEIMKIHHIRNNKNRYHITQRKHKLLHNHQEQLGSLTGWI